MTTTLFLFAVIAVFASFGVVLTYANFMTRSLIAPGARALD